MEERFTQLVTDATVGLKDDPELCLDVQTELRSHLEETAQEYAAEGKGEEESRELAVKSFGSPVEVAGELLDANQRRLRWRALLRLTARALLIPLALLVALLCVGWRAWHAWADARLVAAMNAPAPVSATWLPVTAQALTYLQSTDPNRPESLRNYWETHRTDQDAKVYYANYAGALLAQAKPTLTDFEVAMHQGEQVDPENAFYNYRLAHAYLWKGMIARAEDPRPVGSDQLRDRAYFERGLVELRKGFAKPYFHGYQTALLRKRLAVLPSPRLFEDYLLRTQISNSVQFREFAEIRNLARKIPGCARLLIAEGRRDEAMALLQSWRPFSRQLTDDADSLIHLLVAHAVINIMTHDAGESYLQLGRSDLAQQTTADAQRIMQAVNTLRVQRKNPAVDAYYRKYGSMLLATYGNQGEQLPTREELAPSRILEYTLLEEGMSLLLIGILLLGMITSLLESIHWYYGVREARGAAMLLVPPAPVFARIFGLGIVLPLLVYTIYTHIPVISGRDIALGNMFPRYFIEDFLLLLVLGFLPLELAKRYITRRCRMLGVPVPEKVISARHLRGHTAIWLVGLAAWLVSMLFLLHRQSQGNVTWPSMLLIIFLGFVAFNIFLYLEIQARKAYRLYYGSLTRTLAPLTALTIILIALLTQPYLLHREISSLRQDRVLMPHAGEIVCPLERRTVTDIRTQMLQAMGKR